MSDYFHPPIWVTFWSPFLPIKARWEMVSLHTVGGGLTEIAYICHAVSWY